MQNIYIEIIGPSGSGKSTHLKALNSDSRFTISNRHRVREHMLIFIVSIFEWLCLQLRFGFVDKRFVLLKRVSAYHAALKTWEMGENSNGRGPVHHELHLVDEGVFHILLMHRFASLKEQDAWASFARKEICKLSEERSVIIFFLCVDREVRCDRLRLRGEVESEKFRVANNMSCLPFGPLGADFIFSLKCGGNGVMKVVMLDNNKEGSIDTNIEVIKLTILGKNVDVAKNSTYVIT